MARRRRSLQSVIGTINQFMGDRWGMKICLIVGNLELTFLYYVLINILGFIELLLF